MADAVESSELNGSDIIFIDGLPGSLTITKELIDVADVVVIPLRPGPLDIMGNAPAIKATRKISGRPYLCVINQGRADNSKNVDFTREQLAKLGAKFTKNMILFRDIYGMAMFTGHIAPEKDPAAAEEIAAVWKDIRDELGLKAKAAKASKEVRRAS